MTRAARPQAGPAGRPLSHLLLSPEFRFLVAATRWPRDAAAIAAIRTAALAVADWAMVQTLAEAHDVTCLMIDALKRLDMEIPSVGALAEARSTARDSVAIQLMQLHETQQLAEAFAAAGLPLVVLKGVFSGMDIYGAIGLRESIDIDLLIDIADLDRATALLTSFGYVRQSPPAGASAAVVADSLRRAKDWVFLDEARDHTIELHWRLFQNASLLPQATVALAQPSASGTGLGFGKSVPVLPRDLSQLYLAVHGGEHGWARLKWIADLATIMARNPGADALLLRMAEQSGVMRMVVPGLVLAAELYELQLDEAVLARFRKDWRCRVLLKIAVQSLLAEHAEDETDERNQAATRKNLGHYLVSNNPRHWWRELRYDLLDASKGNSVLAAIAARAANLLKLAARSVLPSPRTGSGRP